MLVPHSIRGWGKESIVIRGKIIKAKKISSAFFEGFAEYFGGEEFISYSLIFDLFVRVILDSWNTTASTSNHFSFERVNSENFECEICGCRGTNGSRREEERQRWSSNEFRSG